MRRLMYLLLVCLACSDTTREVLEDDGSLCLRSSPADRLDVEVTFLTSL